MKLSKEKTEYLENLENNILEWEYKLFDVKQELKFLPKKEDLILKEKYLKNQRNFWKKVLESYKKKWLKKKTKKDQKLKF